MMFGRKWLYLPPMKRLVIFDLDGTLLNTIDDLGTATNHALEAEGIPPTPSMLIP